jgi:hypothetical protein
MKIGLFNQCSQCSRLKSFKPTFNANKSKVLLECMFCKDTTEYDFPTEWNWLSGPPQKDDIRDAWLVHINHLQRSEDSMDVT